MDWFESLSLRLDTENTVSLTIDINLFGFFKYIILINLILIKPKTRCDQDLCAVQTRAPIAQKVFL